ncbi:hypothetical protein D9M71_612010 [compost metagenome]
MRVGGSEQHRVAGGVGAFGHGRAPQLPRRYLGQPVTLGSGIAAGQPAFDKAEVRAKDLRQVGVGCGQIDQQAKQHRQADLRAVQCLGHAQGAEARVAQPAHRLMGQLALLFAVNRAFGNAGKQGGKTHLQLGIVLACVVRGQGCWQIMGTHGWSLKIGFIRFCCVGRPSG